MNEDGLPGELARALAARAQAHLPHETVDVVSGVSLMRAVVEFDAADAAYRTAIGALLPAHKARAVLAALADFRTRAADMRATVRQVVNYGDFDPLDSYAPAVPGSHGDSVRRASATDAARGEVAALRERVNEDIVTLLERAEIEQLMAAKRVRNAAFDRILRGALPPVAGDKLATQLLLLVDGWY